MSLMEEPGAEQMPGPFGIQEANANVTEDDNGEPTQEPNELSLSRPSDGPPLAKRASGGADANENEKENIEEKQSQQENDLLKRELEAMRQKVAEMEAKASKGPKGPSKPGLKAKGGPLGVSKKALSQNKQSVRATAGAKSKKTVAAADKKKTPPKTGRQRGTAGQHSSPGSSKEVSPQQDKSSSAIKKPSPGIKKQSRAGLSKKSPLQTSKPGPAKAQGKPKKVPATKDLKPQTKIGKQKKERRVAESETDLSDSGSDNEATDYKTVTTSKTKALVKSSKYLAYAAGDTELADDVHHAVATLDPLYSIWERQDMETTQFDVLVVGDCPRRTSRILEGIALGKYIVTAEWLRASISKGKWVPYEPYESNTFPGAKISRTEETRVFGELRIGVHGETKLPIKDLKRLITLAGGRLVTDRCDIVVQGDFTEKSSKLNRSESARRVTEKWIFDSIAAYEQQSLDDYKPVK